MMLKDVKAKINHVWLFFTDNCNLGCGYCFYKHRTRKLRLSRDTFIDILKYVRSLAHPEFIFSGGEPLLEFETLKEMIRLVRYAKAEAYVSVQTNAVLLDQAMLDFFTEQRVNIQVGIDGDEVTTTFNRPGTGDIKYSHIHRGVSLAVRSKGDMTTTMVVHPENVSKLLVNLKYLADMGLRTIEVHPAFLEAWDLDSGEVFLDQYRQACAWELKERIWGLIGRGYSEPARGFWDLLVLPSGKVLGSWVFLSFPEAVREHLYLIDFAKDRSGGFLPHAEGYFTALAEHISLNPYCSYRSISNFNAFYAARAESGGGFFERIKHYVDLCERIEAIDRQIMGTIAWRSHHSARVLKGVGAQ